MTEQCVAYGALISTLVSLTAKVKFIHDNTRLVVAFLTLLAALLMDLSIAGFNFGEFFTCWASIAGSALVTNTYVTRPLAEKVG